MKTGFLFFPLLVSCAQMPPSSGASMECPLRTISDPNPPPLLARVQDLISQAIQGSRTRPMTLYALEQIKSDLDETQRVSVGILIKLQELLPEGLLKQSFFCLDLR